MKNVTVNIYVLNKVYVRYQEQENIIFHKVKNTQNVSWSKTTMSHGVNSHTKQFSWF